MKKLEIYIDYSGKVQSQMMTEEDYYRIWRSYFMREAYKNDNDLRLVEPIEEGTIKSKAIKIGEIAFDSVKRTVKSPLSYMAVGISALNEGLKEGNDYKDGIKSAIVTSAWLAGLGVGGDIVSKRDEIKKA